MKLLLDLNVVLDVLLARSPWSADATQLFAAIERGRCRGCLAAHSVTTLDYFLRRSLGRAGASAAIADLITLLEVVPADAGAFQRALRLGFADFEDAVQVIAAVDARADLIVTRDPDGFRGSPVPALPPPLVLARL